MAHYKYLILFPLAALEGPVVSLVVGFLIYGRYLDFFPAFGILILGDLIPDTAYYLLGRFGEKKKIIEKYGNNSKFISNNYEIVKKLWENHGFKTMFFSKLAYGLSTPFLISAGFANIPPRKFISFALPVTLFQYAVLMAIGYYLGRSYELAIVYVKDVQLVFAALIVAAVFVYIIFYKYAERQISKMENEIQT